MGIIEPEPEQAGVGAAPVRGDKEYPRSLSSLKLYSQCSMSWKYQKFDKVPEQPAAWLPQGTAFGRVAEMWEKTHRLMGSTVQEAMYYESFDAEVEKYKERQPDLKKWLTLPPSTKVENDIKNRRERGWNQWVTYRDRCIAEENEWRVWRTPDGEPAVEVSFRVDFGYGPIRGYVDIVKEWASGEITVDDLKTGNREKSTRQLGVYRLGLNEVFGLSINRGGFYYAKDNTYSKMYDLEVWTEDLLRDQFEAQERGIQNRVFIPNVGDFCALCPARNQCPDYNSIK